MSAQQNSGMNFLPKEYDVHLNDFHIYCMNSASMTFILYHGMQFILWMTEYIRHTKWRYELHTALFTDTENLSDIVHIP